MYWLSKNWLYSRNRHSKVPIELENNTRLSSKIQFRTILINTRNTNTGDLFSNVFRAFSGLKSYWNKTTNKSGLPRQDNSSLFFQKRKDSTTFIIFLPTTAWMNQPTTIATTTWLTTLSLLFRTQTWVNLDNSVHYLETDVGTIDTLIVQLECINY